MVSSLNSIRRPKMPQFHSSHPKSKPKSKAVKSSHSHPSLQRVINHPWPVKTEPPSRKSSYQPPGRIKSITNPPPLRKSPLSEDRTMKAWNKVDKELDLMTFQMEERMEEMSQDIQEWVHWWEKWQIQWRLHLLRVVKKARKKTNTN